LESLIARSLGSEAREAVSIRLFDDHVRLYLELPEAPGAKGRTRVVLCASVDVDESGSLVLSFYDIRVFGRLPGAVPASLVARLLPQQASRFVRREGATRISLEPHALLLTSWLPSAGWKVPDAARAQARHVT